MHHTLHGVKSQHQDTGADKEDTAPEDGDGGTVVSQRSQDEAKQEV